MEMKGIAVANAFQKLWEECSRKVNKLWVQVGSEFSNGSMKP